jgi:S1-C subfamily serine protease
MIHSHYLKKTEDLASPDSVIERRKPGRWRILPALVCSFAVATAVEFGTGVPVLADSTASAAPEASPSAPPELGSIEDYGKQSDRGRFYQTPARVPLLGISVFEAVGKLVSGERLNGLAVGSVDATGAGYDAGIQAPHLRKQTAAKELGAMALVIGAAAIFPPALLGVPLLTKMPSPQAYDVIVAVDAERIRDLSELERSLSNAKAGQIIYLTIIREGRRLQLRAFVRSVTAAASALAPK